MLNQIIGLFKTQSTLSDMLGEFSQMLEQVSSMFRMANRTLVGGRIGRNGTIDFYEKDRQVGEHERNIRQKVVAHLSANRGYDAAACLAFMRIVKDAERASDYCKNIFELTAIYNNVVDNGRYKASLTGLTKQVEGLFGKIQKALDNSDESLARRIIAEGNEINGLCNMLIKQIETNDVPTAKAAVYTLAIKYIRRVSSHLTSIAKGIVSSIDKLDLRLELKS